MGKPVDPFLHELVISRLVSQAKAWRDPIESALFVLPEGVGEAGQLLTELLPKKQVCIPQEALTQQVPTPTYDWLYLHMYPLDIAMQQRVFQMLGLLAKDGAALFFSGFSAKTFVELPKYCEPGYVLPVFEDMHNTGDLLGQAGFTDAAISQEECTMSYQDPKSLVNDYHIVVGDERSDLPLRAVLPETCALTVEISLGHAVFDRGKLMRSQGQYEVSLSEVTRKKS